MDYYDELIKNWHNCLPLQSLLLKDPGYREPAIYWVVAHLRPNLTRSQFRKYYADVKKLKPNGALIMQLQWLEKHLKRTIPDMPKTHPAFKAIDSLMEKLTFELECYTIEKIRTSNECIEQDPYKILRARYNHRDID